MQIRKLALTLAFCVFSAPALAVSPATEWEAAALSSSERLFLYTLLKERPRGSGQAVANALRSQGFLQNPKGGNWHARLRGRPLLRFDDNINGGVPGDSFTIGAFEFAVDPESRAKSGIVAGASAQASVAGAVGQGRVVSISGYGSALHALEHDLLTFSAGLESCVKSYAGSWTWIDACAGARYYSEDLSETRESYVSLGLARVFSSAAGSHELRFNVQYSAYDEYEKVWSSFEMLSAIEHVGGLTVAVDIAERVERRNTHLWGLEAKLGRDLLGRRTVFSINYDREGGSEFFGTSRSDSVVSLGVSRDLTERFGASVGVSRRSSSVDLYDDTALLFGIQVQGWTH